MNKRFLTFDFGASSGRGILADYDGQRLSVREIHRFVNEPVNAFGHYYWDLLRLFSEMKTGLLKLRREGITDIASMGVDTWGVDFALLDAYDKPLGNPLYYRDSFTDGEMEAVYSLIPKRELYERTGIQFMKFNTIFQLSALRRRYPAMLDAAKTMLLMPDLLNFMLTGVKSAEYSMASTTQLLDVRAQSWDTEILKRLGLPERIFLPVIRPGQILGETTEAIRDETGMKLPVAAVCGHDTGSAVLAIPMERGERCAYISCGTWSLLGVELDAPRTDDAAYAIEYTNEGGFGGTIRLLKNIMGLWMLQNMRQELGDENSFDKLTELAQSAADYKGRVGVNAECFLAPKNMCAAVKNELMKQGFKEPTVPEMLSCVYHSLAESYAETIKALEKLTGKVYTSLNIVGGGSRDEYLNKLTAKACKLPVYAGPTEGTAIGNLIVQMIADGELASVQQARDVIRDSFEIKIYEP